MGDNQDRIAVTMDSELKKQIRVEAAKRDVSMAELARQILQEEFGTGNRTTPSTAVA